MPLSMTFRALARPCLEHAIAEIRQERDGGLANLVVVFHDQEVSVPPRTGAVRISVRASSRSCTRGR